MKTFKEGYNHEEYWRERINDISRGKNSPIKYAAIKFGDKIWIGKRHGKIIKKMIDERFVTEDGEFLSRTDAYDRAVACGQLKDDGQTRILLSEMLW